MWRVRGFLVVVTFCLLGCGASGDKKETVAAPRSLTPLSSAHSSQGQTSASSESSSVLVSSSSSSTASSSVSSSNSFGNFNSLSSSANSSSSKSSSVSSSSTSSVVSSNSKSSSVSSSRSSSSSSSSSSSARSSSSNSSSSRSSSVASSSNSSSTSALFQITVNVTGLDIGNTLELQNNGANTLTAQRNGSHAFSTRLEGGATYAVFVITQPRNQICTLTQDSGAVTAADVTIFVVCTHPISASLSVANDGSAPWSLQILHGTLGLRNRAYPNTLYESRLAVTGGVFPYEFRVISLTQNGTTVDASDVQLDFRRGLVRWTPTAVGNYVLTIGVKDSATFGVSSIQQAFPISVNTTDFVFVANNGVDTSGAGTFATPYQTIDYALSHAPTTSLIYVRSGNYITNGFSLNASTSVNLLAYPNEKVVLDLQFNGLSYNGNSRLGRIEGFDIINVRQKGIFIDSSTSGLVIRNNRFLNGREFFDGEPGDPGRSENPCYIFPAGGSTTRHNGLTIQDNYFGPMVIRTWLGSDGWPRTSGGSSMVLYDVMDGLVENNLVETATLAGISDKDNSRNNTYRENIIMGPSDSSMNDGFNMMAQDSEESNPNRVLPLNGANGLHIHHNLLLNTNLAIGAQGGVMSNVFMHHNTLTKGVLSIRGSPYRSDSSNYQFTFNVVKSDASAPMSSCDSNTASMFTKFQINKNLYQNSASLVYDNDWCPSDQDANLTRWQTILGFDLDSAFNSNGIVNGSEELSGVATNSAWYGVYGHQY